MAEQDDLTKIAEQFAAEVDGTQPTGAIPSEEELRSMSIEELRALERRVSAQALELGLVHLSASTRKRLAGVAQGPVELSEAIERLPGVLQARSECAKETGITAENCAALSRGSRAVRTLILNADDLGQSAGDRALRMVQINNRTCDTVDQKVDAFYNDQSQDFDRRADTRSAFLAGEHRQAEQARRAQAARQRAQKKLGALQQQLTDKLGAADAVRLLDRFLQDVKDEPPGFTTDASPPVPKGAHGNPPVKKGKKPRAAKASLH